MNYVDLYSSYPDSTIAAAWDSQVKEADKTLWLAEELATDESELFARFAACYSELCALPRSARRALQRRIARSSELAAILPEYLQHGGRQFQQRMAWSVAGAALLLALGQEPVSAATITVTTNNPNIIADGQCSLIEAINNANNDAASFPDCASGKGADTIVLPNANVLLSAVDNNSSGPIGLPLITSQITIEGNGATIARQESAPAFGLMMNVGNLTLRRVTLSGGSDGGLFVGGGVSNSGTLRIENSTISGNAGNAGGGVRNSGTLRVENSTIANNTSNFSGGGLSNVLGTTAIVNSTISGNAGNAGGGVHNSGTLRVENSTIANNTANFYGGGLYNVFGTTTIVNSTISGNAVGSSGGGIDNYAGRLTITNSTISGNTGGGVSNSNGWSFGGAILTLNNSLIAGNQAAAAPEIENIGSIVIANNFNLFGANGNAGITGFTPGPTDIVPSVSLAQILAPLNNNGGPTDTHALVAGSPAIDAGNPNGCRDNAGTLLPTDQRGFARPADGNNDGTVRCDIGAYEANAVMNNNAAFVFQQYIDFLDRGPDAGEVSAWVSALDSGLSRADLIEAFMNSGEFRFEGKFITQTYLGILTRDADYAGFRSWLGALLVGLSREQIVQAFLDSGEFQSRFGSNLTNGQFVERMYNNILLRSSDPGGFNAWVGTLNNGQLTKAQVALSFLDSGEFQGLFLSQNRVDISLLYFDMLQRDPDAGGFSNWVEVLSSGVPLTSVIDGFLNSPEYRAGF